MLTNLKKQLRLFNSRYHILLHGKRHYVRSIIDFFYCAVRHHASAEDFFRYRLFEKNDYERSKFITYGRSKSIIHRFNNSGRTDIFYDKHKFNNFFAAFVKRDWIIVNPFTIQGGGVAEFIKEHEAAIAKPLKGGQGKGIFMIPPLSHIEDLQVFIQSLEGYILEEVIKQHHVLAKINPDSVNTVRIVTFCFNGNVHLISCALRTGIRGAITDNLHSEASQCWAVDPITGIVFTPSFGYDYRSELFHRGSGVKVIGLSCPNWELAVTMVKKAALMIPDVAYVGWDIAIMENDVQLIEGNHDPGHDLMQMGDNRGKYELIKNILQ